MIKILITGIGRLGRRYLEGLSKCNIQLEIFAFDSSKVSLKMAEKSWLDVNGHESKHKLNITQNFDEIPKEIDLAIVATTADVRADLVKNLAKVFKVRFWLLEKILAQSPEQVDELLQNTLNASGIWVNTNRRMLVWHQQLREYISEQLPLKAKVGNNFWDLACNGIHFLDLISWYSGEELVKIDTTELDHDWLESKRPGFMEVTGVLRAFYSKGSELLLESRTDGEEFLIKVETAAGPWIINEFEGKAEGPSGVSLSGKMELQSEMTGRLVESIIETGKCELPSLEESAHIHCIFLDALRIHWNQNCDSNYTHVPIT